MKSQYRIFLILLQILLLGLLFSCESNKKETQKQICKDTVSYRMMNANRILSQNENEMIEDFLSRYQWQVKNTGTGLRYYIYKKTSGVKPKTAQEVKIKFTTSLLNGTILYSSDTDGLKVFELGKAQVESGLEEGILLMKVGEKAKFIIPSHLAFGLLGDQNKIPKKATLVYDVELVSAINLKQNKNNN